MFSARLIGQTMIRTSVEARMMPLYDVRGYRCVSKGEWLEKGLKLTLALQVFLEGLERDESRGCDNEHAHDVLDVFTQPDRLADR